jgi:hypothetical protein
VARCFLGARAALLIKKQAGRSPSAHPNRALAKNPPDADAKIRDRRRGLLGGYPNNRRQSRRHLQSAELESSAANSDEKPVARSVSSSLKLPSYPRRSANDNG